MTRQNFYARRLERGRQEVDLGLVLEWVKFYRINHPRMGVRKIYYLIKPQLDEAGVKLGRDGLFSKKYFYEGGMVEKYVP